MLQMKQDLDQVLETKMVKEIGSEIDHFNPNSPNYVSDHRIEKSAVDQIKEYNNVLKQIKRDLETQKEVMDYI